MRRAGAFASIALLVAGACASQRSPVELISSAPAAAKSKGTSKISMIMQMDIAGPGQSFKTTMKADGVSDLATKRGRIRMTVSTTPVVVATEPCDIVTDATTIYLSIPASRRSPDGKGWAKVDLTKVQGIDPSSLGSDPGGQLDYLKSVSSDVDEIGREDVRGASTTHYRFTVTMDRLAEKVNAATRERLRAQLGQLGIDEFPMDVWIDDDGLPRRVAFEWKASQGQVNLDINVTMEMFDYGAPVEMNIPAAAEVREEPQPQSAFSQCFGGPSVPAGAAATGGAQPGSTPTGGALPGY